MNNKELKSKVMKLGNRLAPRMGGDRRAAYSPADIQAFLVPEPENPADPAAMAVMVGVQGGKGLFRLGYVPRNMAPVVSALGGKVPALRVLAGTWGWANKTTLGARVALAV
jgi:hypothetical protein